MDELSNRKLKNALSILISIKGFSEFNEKFLLDNDIKSKDDFFKMLSKFSEVLDSEDRLNETEKIIINHVKELSDSITYQQSISRIFEVSESKKPSEVFLKDFLHEIEESKTEDLFFEEVKPRRFKTKREFIGLHGIDISEAYRRYKDYNHPYIYYLLSEPLISSKNYSFGISTLKGALRYAFRFPNIFWHSQFGIEGCAWSLYNIQYLLGREGIAIIEKSIPNFKFKLLKLIYLYLSRYIYMSRNDMKSLDFYSNRARLVKDYYMEFIAIFSLGVNPDIQYISDFYLAYQVSVNHNLIGQPFMQLMWESMKMYRHGSHVPNSTGGYKEIEDRTWMELVRDGEKRSIMLAESLLSEFENYELNIKNPEIDLICDYAIKHNKNDSERYLKNLKKQNII